MTAEELEYEFLRGLCDLVISYRRLAESHGLKVPAIGCTAEYLDGLLKRMMSDFGDLEIVL